MKNSYRKNIKRELDRILINRFDRKRNVLIMKLRPAKIKHFDLINKYYLRSLGK